MANPNLTVVVLNLSPTVTLGELTAFFSYCGHVEKILLQGANKDGSQSALVTFRQPYAYQTALLLNDATFAGQPIRVLPKKDFANPPLPHQLPNVTENNRIQGNIPVMQAVVQVMASEGIEKLNQTRDEIGKKYKLSEKSRELMNKTRSAVYAADQAVSAAEEAARDVATRILNTDYIAKGATWMSGVLDKASKYVSELGTRKGCNPKSRKHI
ncbi:protein vip1-like isoform X2 [Herrania umbratica]|uniref:Protein vip1-like isoform X2 n=1 Tax=Herrania umbratica TaxID=108875 RepID=A0A6J1AYX4_9ROSI|nr:protein vip1-like isoform X2 [Herrania umbratica]